MVSRLLRTQEKMKVKNAEKEVQDFINMMPNDYGDNFVYMGRGRKDFYFKTDEGNMVALHVETKNHVYRYLKTLYTGNVLRRSTLENNKGEQNV